MTTNSGALARACDGLREVIHPLVSGFLPVTYTEAEARRRIAKQDPRAARKNPAPNAATRQRILGIARDLALDSSEAERFLGEAYDVIVRQPVQTNDQPDLPSPMCSEDKYTMYVLTRILRPERVVETGVAHGVSSAFMLFALRANENGRLDSIETLSDPRVGQMIPDDLKDRWQLHRGDSLGLLPSVCKTAGAIDLFVHDSLHTYRHMRSEFEVMWPYLASGGVLVAHDICHSNAFDRFVSVHAGQIERVARGVNLGAIRKS